MGVRKEKSYDMKPKKINNANKGKSTNKRKSKKIKKKKDKFRFNLNFYIAIASLTILLNFVLPRVGDMIVNVIFVTLIIVGIVQYSNYRKK